MGSLPLCAGTPSASCSDPIVLLNEEAFTPRTESVGNTELAAVSPSVMTGDLWWNKTYTLGDESFGRVVIPLDDGGYALFGDIYTDENSRQFGMVRVNATGQAIVNVQYGGSDPDYLHDAIEVSAGGFIMVGDTFSYGAGMYDIWVIRVDENGNHMWNRTFGSAVYEWGRAVVESSTGGLLVLGQTEPSLGSYDVKPMLIRLDEMGAPVWSKTYNTALDSYVDVTDLVECNDGGYAFIGRILFDGWLFRVDSLGNQLWNCTYGTAEGDFLTAIMKLDDSGFVLAGMTYGEGSGGTDIWMIWTDDGGNLTDNKVYGGPTMEQCRHAIQLKNGGFVVTGSYRYPGLGGYYGILFMRIDSSGELLLNRHYGQSPGDPYQGCGIAEVEHGGVAICATGYNSTLKFHLRLLVIPEVKWLEEPSDIAVDISNSLSYSMSADSAAGISEWTLNDTSRFSISRAGFITNSTPLGIGTFPLEVTAEDSLGNSISGEFSIEVYDHSPPLLAEQPPDQLLELGDEFLYDLNATDPSGPLEWSCSDEASFTVDSGGIVRSLGTLSVGPHSVLISVQDAYGNMASIAIVVIVQDTTAPKWVTAPANQFVLLGEPVQYQLAATDLSGIVSWRVDDVANFTMSETGLLTSIGILDAGSYPLQVTVEDSYGNEAVSSFTVYVLGSSGSTTLAPVDWGTLLAVGGVGFGAGVIIISVVYLGLRSRRKDE